MSSTRGLSGSATIPTPLKRMGFFCWLANNSGSLQQVLWVCNNQSVLARIQHVIVVVVNHCRFLLIKLDPTLAAELSEWVADIGTGSNKDVFPLHQ
uniref:Uncharacterized protein n=1 Tax=Anguilla anguilla TaxID=7936 RepID=A0A0E9U6V7_ANGAN